MPNYHDYFSSISSNSELIDLKFISESGDSYKANTVTDHRLSNRIRAKQRNREKLPLFDTSSK